MGNFNRGNRSGWERKSFSDRGSRGPVQMHRAVCDNCKKDCEVPFRPTSGKPIFCSSCFESRNSERPARFNDRQVYNGKSNQEQFDQLNNKLDKILAMLAPKERS
ncbi:hypothetical protein HYU95_00385 [Candidatus Daviesbacteria bacterium]|nr:hypothetical protein [Candidatus Daviesbacteria bacterium]